MAQYEITVRVEGDKSKKNPIAGNGASAKKSTGAEESEGVSAQEAVKKGLVAYKAYVKPFINQVASINISSISLRTGAEELQDKVTFGYSVAQSALGIAESITIGALAGGAVGAVVGAVMSVSTTALGYVYKAQQLSWQQDVEDISLSGANVRAGGSVATFSGSRGRNQ